MPAGEAQTPFVSGEMEKTGPVDMPMLQMKNIGLLLPFPVRMDIFSPPLWAVINPTGLDSMTCWAMYWNGARTDMQKMHIKTMTVITTGLYSITCWAMYGNGARTYLHRAGPAGWTVAVVGAAILPRYVAHPAAGTPRTFGVTAWAFVCLGSISL